MSKFSKMLSVLLLAVFCIAMPLRAQKIIESTDPELRLKWYDQHAAMKEKSIFKHLPWQFIGPTNIGGRATDVDVLVPKGDYYTLYVAEASGGVWKSTNEGVTWKPVYEHGPSTSIGDVTVAPSDQRIVWIGQGEANIFRSSMAGAGVCKSTDGGKTWKHMGLAGTHTIPRIVIHPGNPDIVYVAASGHEWTNNPERGVYKTTNGGDSWEKVLYIDEKTGAIDLVMDPSDTNTLYAATWQRIRKRWNDPRNEPGYDGSGIYKTTDAGAHWQPINKGLPDAQFRGRIGIDICRSKPNVLYAFIDNYEIAHEAEEGELDAYGRQKKGTIKGATVFRTDNGGETWRQVSESNQYMERLSATYGWVFGQIRIDPNDEDVIYVMGLGLNQSTDGGKTFKPLRGMHGDHHGLWIDPSNSNYLFNAQDGGVGVSYDFGKNWRVFTHNLPAVQFFNINYDMDTPFRVYGSIQDHGSWRGVVDLSSGRDNIPAVEFTNAPGGEGCSHAIDPTNPNRVYSAGFYGRIQRSDYVNGEWHTETILPEVKKGEPPLRGQWVAPFILSPHSPNIIYHGMQYVFRSVDQGDTWKRISPDLTYNDPEKMGDIPYQTIFAISESPIQPGLIYAGTDDGKVHVTHNGGEYWEEIMDGLPYKKWVSRIAASKYDRATVYMSQNGKRHDDFAAYLWKSTNYGRTWTDITNNVPCGPVNVIREDPKNENVLYIGTDLGVYVSLNKGEHWYSLPCNVPTTFVHDLIIHPRDDIMVIATHGRGMYAMDVRYIQQMDQKLLDKTAHIFKVNPATLPMGWRRGAINASVYYYLKNPQNVNVTISDKSGKIIRRLESTGDAGINRVIWDLQTADEKYVKAGTYKVTLTAGYIKVEAKITVNAAR